MNRIVITLASILVLAGGALAQGRSTTSVGGRGFGISVSSGANGVTASGHTPVGAISVSAGQGPGSAAATSTGKSASAISSAMSALGKSVAGAVGVGPSGTATTGN